MTIQRKRVAKRLASGLLAGALALGGLAISGGTVSAKTPSSPSTNRFAGADRYETAVALALNYSTTSGATNFGKKGVVVASGESPYDALSAAALAGKVDAPIILVKKDSVPESVANALSDNVANFRQASSSDKVWFVGGTSAISDAVKDSIMEIVTASDALPIGSVRVAGATRYDTAVQISKVSGVTDYNDVIVIVNGADGQWADALTAGPLAASKKWPILLTGNGGLNDQVKTRFLEYQALSSSVNKVLLVGGPAVLPTSVEDWLIANDVPVSNIFRVAGADRYQTSVNMNVAVSALGKQSELQIPLYGTSVALATGASPWDALTAGPWAAAKGYHLALTSSPAPNAATVGLIGQLSVALKAPTNLYIVGGRSAVTNDVRDAVIATAQGAVNQTSAISGCVAGAESIAVTIPGGLGAPTAARVETVNDIVTGSANAYWKLDGVKDSVTSFITTFTDISVKDDGTTANRETFLISLNDPLAEDSVVSFTGFDEVDESTSWQAVAGSSCTVAGDDTPPTATIRPLTRAGDFAGIEVTLSEPISGPGTAASSNLYPGSPTAVSLSASVNQTVNYWTGLSYNVSDADYSGTTLSAVALDSSYTRYLVTYSGTVPTYSGDSVTLEKEAIVDDNGNMMEDDVTVDVAADATAATMSLGAITCRASGTASMTRGSLTVTALSAANGGAWSGRRANALSLRVVNQRGLTVPTIELDTTNNLIVVTADTGYHTPTDLKTVANNTGFSGSWSIGASDTKLTTTLVDIPATGGSDNCTGTITYNEAAYSLSTDRVVTVAGVTVSETNTWKTNYRKSESITFPAVAVGNATVVVSASTNNSAGVQGAKTASNSLP